MRLPSPKREPRDCWVCGAEFVPKIQKQRICGSERCKAASRLGAVMAPVSWSLPCYECAHSRPQPEAVYGVECTINRWLLCKPMNNGAKPYAPKEENNA